MHEELAQMRTELELVLKHVSGVAEKVNAVNYLAKPPPPAHEYYYEDDTYAVNEQMGVSDKTPKAPIRRIEEIKVGTMATTIERSNMFEMETTTETKSSTEVTIVIRMIRVGPIFPHKIGKFLLRTGEVLWRELKICYKR